MCVYVLLSNMSPNGLIIALYALAKGFGPDLYVFDHGTLSRHIEEHRQLSPCTKLLSLTLIFNTLHSFVGIETKGWLV